MRKVVVGLVTRRLRPTWKAVGWSTSLIRIPFLMRLPRASFDADAGIQKRRVLLNRTTTSWCGTNLARNEQSIRSSTSTFGQMQSALVTVNDKRANLVYKLTGVTASTKGDSCPNPADELYLTVSRDGSHFDLSSVYARDALVKPRGEVSVTAAALVA